MRDAKTSYHSLIVPKSTQILTGWLGKFPAKVYDALP